MCGILGICLGVGALCYLIMIFKLFSSTGKYKDKHNDMPSGAAAMIAAINERTKEFAKMDIKCETSKPFASEAEYTKFEEDYCKSCFKNKNGIYCKTREACKNSLQNEWIVDMVCDGIKYPHICQLFDEKGVTRTLTGEIV